MMVTRGASCPNFEETEGGGRRETYRKLYEASSVSNATAGDASSELHSPGCETDNLDQEDNAHPHQTNRGDDVDYV